MSTQAKTATSAGSLLFRNVADCKSWIAALPITNVLLAQQTVCEQLILLAATELPALERLKILEALKETALFTQAEVAKRYIGKPLPLDRADAVLWSRVIALWQGLEQNYRLCLDAVRKNDISVSAHAALITLRCLRMVAYRQFEHYVVYREPDESAWRDLHGLYTYAEEQALTRVRVQDVFNKQEADASCGDIYVAGLLAELANPYALSVRQMAFLRRWLDKWAPLVSLTNQPLPNSPAAQIPQLAVDTRGAIAPGLASDINASGAIRYLDMEPLSKTLRQTINLLKQGQTPGQLGLGDDARQPGCENLIMLLYLQWCRAGTLRTDQRTATQDSADVSFGIADGFELLGGDNRTQREIEFNARDKWEIDNLGFSMRLSSTARMSAVKKSESWEILNKSASGFMCMLREPSGLMRMSHNQLLTVRVGPDNTRAGTLQWIRINPKGECRCGVRLFPGSPRPIKVRPANINPSLKQALEPALVIPEATMPKAPMSILLPAGWFQTGRVIETQAESKRNIKLLTLLERGTDFDRCAIAAASD